MLKKVAIVTITADLNFGNRLQNYALQYFVKNLSFEVYSILDSYNSWHVQFNWIKHIKESSLKGKIAIMINYKQRRQIIKRERFRQKNFLKFNREYINWSKITVNYDKVPQKLNDTYDYFIVGSDQVWNPNFKCTNYEFLTFASPHKRIAYAASFGISKIPEEKENQFKFWLEGMKHISVREDAGAEIVKRLTDRNVPVLVDPTLLLTKEEWIKVEKKPVWYEKDDYILTYFLGERPVEVDNEIQRLGEEKNLKVIHLMDYNNADWFSIGPSEFLFLIHNCRIMYTDSFHGTVFSILMNIPFVICERVQKDLENMNSRIDTLLNLFHLENRRGTEKNKYSIENPLEIEYLDIEGILDVERKRSEEYIRNALNDKIY